MTKEKRYALIVIDMQREYFKKDGPLFIPDGPRVAENLLHIMKAARDMGMTIAHVRHIAKDPRSFTFRAGDDNVEFVDGFMPEVSEPVVTKTRPGSFYLTDLDDILRSRAIDSVIIGGLMSFMCCDTTAREAHARGYAVYFLRDATAALDVGGVKASVIHETVCAVQGMVFSRVVTTHEMIGIIEKGENA